MTCFHFYSCVCMKCKFSSLQVHKNLRHSDFSLRHKQRACTHKHTHTLFGLQWKLSFFSLVTRRPRLCQLLGFLKRQTGTWYPCAEMLAHAAPSGSHTSHWCPVHQACNWKPSNKGICECERICARVHEGAYMFRAKVVISIKIRLQCV